MGTTFLDHDKTGHITWVDIYLHVRYGGKEMEVKR